MTNKFTKMTAADTFDARVNTDGLTIQGNWRDVTALCAPAKHPGGNCVYKPRPGGYGVDFVSTDQPTPQFDIKA